MRPSAPRSQQLWRQIRSALGIGTAAATGSASLLWRNNVLACEEEGKQQHSESTLSKIKTSLTPASALAFQKRLEDWNKSFDDLVLLSQRLYSELSFADDSLARHIVDNDRLDKQLHPELDWDARVRLSDEPCFQERAFFRQRQRKIRVAYAKLLQVPEDEVDVRDLPVFGIAASGGGYRALVNTTGALSALQSTGLMDYSTYVAGISGSCWSLSGLYSLANGHTSFLREHIKSRIQTDFLNPQTLDLLTQDPPARYLLSGMLIKQTVGKLDLADVYGTLVSSRVLLPDDTQSVSFDWLRLSSQTKHLERAQLPLPIYSMVRHDVTDVEDAIKDQAQKSAPSVFASSDEASKSEDAAVQQNRDLMSAATWQWFELTPYEVGSPDLDAWIPSWSLGRTFQDGKSLKPQPELSMTVMNGIFASAFSATLFHYYNEMKPLLKSVNLLSSLSPLINDYQHHMSAIHPFPPAELPNFVKGVKGLKRTAPGNISQLDSLGFMDAGAWLNLPYLPLLRRNCDVILALDASADSQDLWFQRAEEYAEQLNMTSWPKIQYQALFKASVPEKEDEPLGEANRQQAKSDVSPSGRNQPDSQALPQPQKDDDVDALEDFNIWIGSSDLTNKSSRVATHDAQKIEQTAKERDGIALVYVPLRSQEVMDTWSTWRFEYPASETEKLLKVAEDNIKNGDPHLQAVLKGIYHRKRARRLREAGNDVV